MKDLPEELKEYNGRALEGGTGNDYVVLKRKDITQAFSKLKEELKNEIHKSSTYFEEKLKLAKENEELEKQILELQKQIGKGISKQVKHLLSKKDNEVKQLARKTAKQRDYIKGLEDKNKEKDEQIKEVFDEIERSKLLTKLGKLRYKRYLNIKKKHLPLTTKITEKKGKHLPKNVEKVLKEGISN